MNFCSPCLVNGKIVEGCCSGFHQMPKYQNLLIISLIAGLILLTIGLFFKIKEDKKQQKHPLKYKHKKFN